MKKGFTLIELLVVVLIIGILSAVALPQYTVAVEKARMSEAIANIGNLQKAINIYLMSNGTPNSTVNLVGKPGFNALAGELDIDLQSILNCPEGDEFCYSKNYRYQAYCATAGCNIWVEQNKGDYRLQRGLDYSDMGEWYGRCIGADREGNCSSLGNKICKSLDSNEWDHYLCTE